MLGRTKLSLPVCSLSRAPPWAAFVPWSERRMQRSSTHCATWGEFATGRPLWPWFLKAQGDFSRAAVGANCTRGFCPGNGLPSSRSRSGLGSKVSTWDGPPFMKRKMTRWARGGKWGCRGARGEGRGPAGVGLLGVRELGAEIHRLRHQRGRRKPAKSDGGRRQHLASRQCAKVQKIRGIHGLIQFR